MPDLTAPEVDALDAKQHTVTLAVIVRVDDHELIVKQCGTCITEGAYRQLRSPNAFWRRMICAGENSVIEALDEARKLL